MERKFYSLLSGTNILINLRLIFWRERSFFFSLSDREIGPSRTVVFSGFKFKGIKGMSITILLTLISILGYPFIYGSIFFAPVVGNLSLTIFFLLFHDLKTYEKF